MTIEQDCARGGRPQAIIGKICVSSLLRGFRGIRVPLHYLNLRFLKIAGNRLSDKNPEGEIPLRRQQEIIHEPGDEPEISFVSSKTPLFSKGKRVPWL